MPNNYLYSEISSEIIKAFYKVYNKLGHGFLERVYQNSLLLELKKLGLNCDPLRPIDVFYENIKVGFYVADIIVNDCMILEIKAMESLREEHEAQLVNYLKATDIEVGLLLNFGKNQNSEERCFQPNTKILIHHDHHKNQRSVQVRTQILMIIKIYSDNSCQNNSYIVEASTNLNSS